MLPFFRTQGSYSQSGECPCSYLLRGLMLLQGPVQDSQMLLTSWGRQPLQMMRPQEVINKPEVLSPIVMHKLQCTQSAASDIVNLLLIGLQRSESGERGTLKHAGLELFPIFLGLQWFYRKAIYINNAMLAGVYIYKIRWLDRMTSICTVISTAQRSTSKQQSWLLSMIEELLTFGLLQHTM